MRSWTRKRSRHRCLRALKLSADEMGTLPVERLVARMLMRMTQKQYQLRCYSDKVHYVLNKEHQKEPLLTSNDVRRLLSKTPRFIHAPRKISRTAVADDCYKFGYSLVKAFD